MNNSKLVFIGGGNMATSLVGGLCAAGVPASNITVVDPQAEQRARLAAEFPINTAAEASSELLAAADVVTLAVKPQILQSVCRGLAAQLADCETKPLVLSVAAGIRAGSIKRWLGGDVAIVRAMPNTPALIQAGATALVADAACKAEQKSLAEEIMRTAGLCVWVKDEADIDAVTAISGSGPAYFFLFIEALEAAGEKLGLEARTSRLLALQTAFGAARMALESDEDPAELRRKVTSPGGTTEQAILSFENNQLRALVEAATQAAATRSLELANQLGNDALPNGDTGEAS
jgi:pyrroline-5-carboxylate reductase